MAIVKGIEDGQFIRPKSTSIANQMSLTGRLRLKKATTSKLLPKPPKATKKLAGKDSHLHSPSSSDNEISSSDSRPAKGPAQVKKPTKSKKLPDGEDHNNDDVNEENKKKSAKSKKRANGKDNNNNDDDDNDKNGMDEKKKPRKGVTKPTTSKVSEGAKDSSKSKKATSSGKSTKKAQN